MNSMANVVFLKKGRDSKEIWQSKETVNVAINSTRMMRR